MSSDSTTITSNYRLFQIRGFLPSTFNRRRLTSSIFRNSRINLVRPREDSALQVQDFAEAGFAQEIDGFSRALTATAVSHDFTRSVELVHAPRQFTERNQFPVQIADLIFVRFAHVENEKIVALVETRLQFLRCDLWNAQVRSLRFFAANSAELVVIDELVDRAMLAAHRAIRILAQLQFAELHSERIEQKQATNETVAFSKNQLDRFHRLNRSDDSWQDTENTAFRARRNESRRRRFGIKAAVARPVGHAEHGDLSLEAEDRSVHVGLAEQDARIVDQIARREIVGAVDDDVVILEQFERVAAFELRFVRLNLDIWIQVREPLLRRLGFRLADIARTERNLPLQIRKVDNVEIDEPEFADSGRGEIQTERGAESACADQQHLGVLELELTFHADFGHDQVAALAENLFVGEAGCCAGSGRFC